MKQVTLLQALLLFQAIRYISLQKKGRSMLFWCIRHCVAVIANCVRVIRAAPVIGHCVTVILPSGRHYLLVLCITYSLYQAANRVWPFNVIFLGLKPQAISLCTYGTNNRYSISADGEMFSRLHPCFFLFKSGCLVEGRACTSTAVMQACPSSA